MKESAEGSPSAASGESRWNERVNWHKKLADRSCGMPVLLRFHACQPPPPWCTRFLCFPDSIA